MKGLIRVSAVVVAVVVLNINSLFNWIDNECVKCELKNTQTTINMYVDMNEWDMVEHYVSVRDSLKAIVK